LSIISPIDLIGPLAHTTHSSGLGSGPSGVRRTDQRIGLDASANTSVGGLFRFRWIIVDYNRQETAT
jgi:hypothetical protein